MKELQNKIIHALGLVARATKENPQRAMRAVKIYERLMAQKQNKLLKELRNEQHYYKSVEKKRGC